MSCSPIRLGNKRKTLENVIPILILKSNSFHCELYVNKCDIFDGQQQKVKALAQTQCELAHSALTLIRPERERERKRERELPHYYCIRVVCV